MPYPFSPGEILTAANLNASIGVNGIDELTPTAGTTATFSAIPATFTHLKIVGSVRHNDASGGNAHRIIGLQFNGDTAANYNYASHSFDGTPTMVATRADAQTAGGIAQLGDVNSTFEIMVLDYTNAIIAKSAQCTGVSRLNTVTTGTNIRNHLTSCYWTGTAAITSIAISILAGGGDVFASGSNRITLYGFS